MKLSLLCVPIAAALLIVGCGAFDPSDPGVADSSMIGRYDLVPRPVNLEPAEGEFRLKADTPVLFDQAESRAAAEYFAGLVAPATGFDLQPVAATDRVPGAIIFETVNAEFLGSTNPEAYRVTIDEGGVQVQAATERGLFYGVQTLRQLLPHEIEIQAAVNDIDWLIPAARITDEPLYGYRGMHLDVSRSFFPVWFIKRYIDLLALHKINHFHWHLTDDQGWRIPIDGYPRLTEVSAWRDQTVVGHASDRDNLFDGQRTGGFYSKADIRDIVAYAAERHITIMPEIDIPGHATTILAAYPEFGCDREEVEVQQSFGIFPEVLCPRENTFAMLKQVFTEVAELFPGEYIHLGGDEVVKRQWQECDDCTELMQRENLKDYHELQSYFVGRVADIIHDLGRKPVGWNEILDGGLPENATVVSWQGIEGGIEAARLGHDAIMAPVTHLYFDFFQSNSADEPMAIHGLTTTRKVYSYDPIPDELKGKPEAAHIIGAQGQLWTEYITTPEKAEYMLLPRLSALAEIVWTPREKQSWDHFSQRLDSLFARFDEMRANAARSIYAVDVESRLQDDRAHQVTLKTQVPGQIIRYTTDGSRPTVFSPEYKSPLALQGNVTVRARAQNPATGELYHDFHQTLTHHKALGAEVTVAAPANDWPPEKLQALVDGQIATDQVFFPDDWVVVYGDALDVHLDLGDAQSVSEIRMGFNPGRYRRMHAPSEFEVFTSSDGFNWESRGQQDANDLKLAQSEIRMNFPAVSARFVRVHAKNQTETYSNTEGKWVRTPLYIDEIVVK